ncbi:MAG: hypothetical protein AAF571_12220 [Verrucomicrobiota bacterium]
MTDWLELFWWLHFASSCAMIGIIWFVQLVHYPLFRSVGNNEYPQFHTQHILRTGFLLAPLMLAEMGSGLVFLILSVFIQVELMLHSEWFTISMLLLAVIWVSTFLVQVRHHLRLDQGKDEATIERLISTNWLRTILWSVRLPLLILAISG